MESVRDETIERDFKGNFMKLLLADACILDLYRITMKCIAYI